MEPIHEVKIKIENLDSDEEGYDASAPRTDDIKTTDMVEIKQETNINIKREKCDSGDECQGTSQYDFQTTVKAEPLDIALSVKKVTKSSSSKGSKKKHDEIEEEDIVQYIDTVTITEKERQAEHADLLAKRGHYQLKCQQCALGFVATKAYEKHMKSHTPESGNYKCDICSTYLKSGMQRHQHRLRHYRRYRCMLCAAPLFRDKDTAACHIRADHCSETICCGICKKGFKRPQYLKIHMEQQHERSNEFRCELCPRVFYNRNFYRCHIRTHDDGIREQSKTVRSKINDIPCDVCSKICRDQNSLKQHKNKMHGTPVYCDVCHRRFRNKDLMMRHCRKMHMDKGPPPEKRQCPICEKVLASDAMLKIHHDRQHAGRAKKYQCDDCKKYFFSRSEVRCHIEWVHMRTSKGLICDLCPTGTSPDRRFRNQSLLNKHILKVHHAVEPVRDKICPECGKGFPDNQQLKRHQRIHADEKHPCPECSESFKTPDYVKIHVLVKHRNMTRADIKAMNRLKKGLPVDQPGVKDKICNQCGKGFASNDLLKRHTMRHSGIKYPCKECGEEFKCPSYVNLHYKIKHLGMTRDQIKAQKRAKKAGKNMTAIDAINGGNDANYGGNDANNSDGSSSDVEVISDSDSASYCGDNYPSFASVDVPMDGYDVSHLADVQIESE